MVKWALRFLVGLIVIDFVVVAGGAVSFSLWKAGIERELAAGSEVVVTARGPIEVADVGDGLPFLSLHGTPGGYDQVLSGRRAAPDAFDGWRTIAVSRPGYLRTPLSSGATFEEQADLFAALLDELGVERVVVYAASGGGYAGLQFALRHPDRTLGLILYAPAVNTEPLPDDWRGMNASEALIAELTMWVADGPLFGALASSFIPELDPSDPEQVALARAMTRSLVPIHARAIGRENDLRQRSDLAIDHWPLERIAAPTLILHGDADENAPYGGSVRVAAKIPNAELVTFEGGDHFIILTRADEVRDHVARFVSGLED